MRRVVVVGNSGAGKTTLARQLAAILAVPHVELDAHFHQAGWQPTPRPQFWAAVAAELDRADLEASGWVTCGNYASVRTLLWARADTVVWLDYPRSLVMYRVTRRTFGRVVRRRRLWNDNRERLREVLALHDAERSILRWSWDGTARYRRAYEGTAGSQLWAGIAFHRLHRPEDAAALLATARGVRHGR